MTIKTISLAALVGALAFGAVACEEEPSNASRVEEENVAEQQLSQFLQSQPIPVYNWSQLRQNLIEISAAQANTTATTTFFFNQGIADPITVCPSIGFPIASTAQLTNPDQVITPGRVERGSVTVAQLESTGVYTGESTGTYVICIDGDGKAYAQYWEGFVSTVSGPATWNTESKRIVLTGDPTGDFTSGK